VEILPDVRSPTGREGGEAMIRFLIWFLFWCLCLGFVGIDVTYVDGLRIRLYNHSQRRAKRLAGKEEKP